MEPLKVSIDGQNRWVNFEDWHAQQLYRDALETQDSRQCGDTTYLFGYGPYAQASPERRQQIDTLIEEMEQRQQQDSQTIREYLLNPDPNATSPQQ